MGWASGSVLCEDLIGILIAEVPDAAVRLRVYRKLIDAFEGNDCDTLGDCQGLDNAFDRALREKHPHWFDDEDEEEPEDDDDDDDDE